MKGLELSLNAQEEIKLIHSGPFYFTSKVEENYHLEISLIDKSLEEILSCKKK